MLNLPRVRDGHVDFHLVNNAVYRLRSRPSHAQSLGLLDVKNEMSFLEEEITGSLREWRQREQLDDLENNFYIEYWQILFELTPKIASEILSFFENEVAAGRRKNWKKLHLMQCLLNDPLKEVLQYFKTAGLFSLWTVEQMSPSEGVVLEFCKDSRSLKHLIVQRALKNRRLMDDDFPLNMSCILGTTGIGQGRGAASSLECLDLVDITMTRESARNLADGLMGNDSLVEVKLQSCNTSDLGLPSSIIAALEGHQKLQVLKLPFNFIPASAMQSLGLVMKSPSCTIRSLDLSFSRSVSVSRTDMLAFFQVGLLADALDGCRSIERLCLSCVAIDPAEAHRLLDVVDTCPLLRDINLSCRRGNIEVPFWDSSDEKSSVNGDLVSRRKSLWRLNLQGHPVTAYDTVRVTRFDEEMQTLLLRYPALGEINNLHRRHFLQPFHSSFSLRTIQLLSFNYAGRAQLDRPISPSIWPLVLERLYHGVRNGLFFLPFEDDGNQDQGMRRLFLSGQASILFSLLRECPMQVTLEACHAHASFDSVEEQICKVESLHHD